MATDIRLKEALPEITEALVATYTECSRLNHLGHHPLPSRDAVLDILADLFDVLYPGYARKQNLHIGNHSSATGSYVVCNLEGLFCALAYYKISISNSSFTCHNNAHVVGNTNCCSARHVHVSHV